MLIIGSVRRILKANSRRSTMLLVRVAEKTIKGTADEQHAASGPYASLRPFIIVFERDVVPAYDPRLELLLDVEPLEAREPFQLDGVERQLQAKEGGRLASSAEGHALSYVASACINVKMTTAAHERGITVSLVKAALPAALQPQLAREMRGKSSARLERLADIDAMLARLPRLSQTSRWNTVALFADTRMSAEYSALVSHGVGSPSSLQRLSAAELAKLVGFFTNVLSLAGPNPPPRLPLIIGRLADLLPLSLVGTRRRVRLHPTYERAWSLLPQADALDALVNGARATQSTVGKLDSPLDGASQTLLSLVPALVRARSENDDGGGRFALARDQELELESARLVRSRTRLVVVAAAGDVSVLDTVERRLRDLAVAPYLDSDMLYVAPTASHAAVCPFDALSVDDVLAGRYAHGRRPSALVLVFAHAFGVDSFVHCVRAFDEATRVLVLVGDPYDSNGSPRESDRGCVLRDVAAAARRGALANTELETLFGFSAVGPLNALGRAEHTALRHYKQPMLPLEGDASYTIVASLDDVPADECERSLTLVGALTMSQAAKATGASPASVREVRDWIAFDDLGQVARVTRRARLRSVVRPLAERVSIEAGESSTAPMPLDTLGGCVELNDGVGIDHTYCCHTTSPTVAVLDMHASRRAFAVAPARLLARITPVPIADALPFIVTEKTGIDDIRAAFALVRRRLYIVADTRAAVDAALARKSARPRTQLVDFLLDDSNRSSAPSPLLLASPPPPPPPPPPEPASVEVPFRFLYLGSTDSDSVLAAAAGLEQAGAQRLRVRVGALHEHLNNFLRDKKMKRAASATRDEEDTIAAMFRPPPPSTTTTMPSTTMPSAFSPAHVDAATLWRLPSAERVVDSLVRHRLWALVRARRIGSLGDDMEDEVIEEAYRTYPGSIADDLVVDDAAAIVRAREAAVIQLFCVIVARHDDASSWYVDAELALARDRARRAGAEDVAATTLASTHANAVRRHLVSVEPPPEPDDMDATEAYDLFSKLHDVRAYIIARLP